MYSTPEWGEITGRIYSQNSGNTGGRFIKKRRKAAIELSYFKLIGRKYQILSDLSVGNAYFGFSTWIPRSEDFLNRKVFLTGRYYDEMREEVYRPVAEINLETWEIRNISIPDPVQYPASSRAVRLWLRAMGLNVVRFGSSMKVGVGGGFYWKLPKPFFIPRFGLKNDVDGITVCYANSRAMPIEDNIRSILNSDLSLTHRSDSNTASQHWVEGYFPGPSIFDRYFTENPGIISPTLRGADLGFTNLF